MNVSLRKILTAALCFGVIGVPIGGMEVATPSDATNSSTSRIKVENLNLIKKW